MTLPAMSRALDTRDDVPIYAGCFDISIPLVSEGYYKYQSSGYCAGICSDKGEPVLGLSNGTICWCGNFVPPAEAKVPDSKCNTPCHGYDLEDCTFLSEAVKTNES